MPVASEFGASGRICRILLGCFAYQNPGSRHESNATQSIQATTGNDAWLIKLAMCDTCIIMMNDVFGGTLNPKP